MKATKIQYPEYIVVDTYPHAKQFKVQLHECIGLMTLDPSPTYDQMRAMFSGIPGMQVLSMRDQAHITAQQWYEEILHQIFSNFTIDLTVYSQHLQQLPHLERLLHSESRLVTNPVLVQTLQKAVCQFGLQLYFDIREQGLFEALVRHEYILHHPGTNSLMLYRARDIYHTPDY
ncbi:MAG: hypothetical protein ACR2HF_08900 [Methylococcaceae bacterium]